MAGGLQRSLQVVHESIRALKNPDDTVLLAETDNDLREDIAETNAETLADNTDAIMSQILQIMFGTEAGHRWSDVPPLTLIDIANAGIPVKNEVPGGARDCANLAFTTAFEFVPGTLEVYLDGRKMTPGLDYNEDIGFQSFTFLLNPNDKNRLKVAPKDSEDILVNYCRRIT